MNVTHASCLLSVEETVSELISRTEMLIRKPVSDVFSAFTNTSMLEKFWLKRAKGALAEGAVVEWEFMVEGAQDIVTVTEFSANQLISFKFSDGVAVELQFEPWADAGTRLGVNAVGFSGEGAVSNVVEATEGFSIVLCDLKTLLETGTSAGMVRDKAELISARHDRINRSKDNR
jgi:uncharacterized protein YndB with AHSA1/START domain